MQNVFRVSFVIVAASFVLGVVGGTGAGWIVSDQRVLEPAGGQVTTTANIVQVVQVEREPSRPIYPSVFSARTTSPVASLVRRSTAKSLEDRLMNREQAIGQVIALTSDGWFATPFVNVSGLRVAEMGIVWNGQVYPIIQATRDAATDVVFLKTEAQGLPSVRFVSASDVASGMNVWMEPSAKRLSMEIVTDAHSIPALALSSERASRRFLLSGDAFPHAVGGAVWSETGGLVGLLEPRTADGWRGIPASNISSALTALLNKQEITHASLGVHGLDLSTVALEKADRASLPTQGIWLKGISAVSSTLREGDVIERFERDILDGSADLGERLLEYVPGSKVVLYGMRGGLAWQGEVMLGSVTTGEKLK